MAKHIFSDLDNIPDCIEPGVYAGTIISAVDKIAKSSGNDMIEIVWEIDGNTAKPPFFGKAKVYDYLVFSPKTGFKLDTFLKACGKQPAKGEEVELSGGGVLGWRCWLNIGVEKSENPQYGDRNKVLQYVTNHPEPLPEIKKEDIPF